MTITADNTTLLKQAPMTAETYFIYAYSYFEKEDIEPSDALVIAFVEACTKDFNNSIRIVCEQEQREHENELALDQAAHELRMQAESHRHELAIMDTPIQMDD